MSFIEVDTWKPPHLSYSTVAGYRDCGKRTQLSKVFQLEEVPGIAAIGGNAVHTATEIADDLREQYLAEGEEWNNELVDAKTLFLEGWMQAMEDRGKRSPSFSPEQYVATGRASKEYGFKRGVSWWLDNGPQMVQSWLTWREETKWEMAWLGETPGIEFAMTFTLPGDIPVRGFIDRVMVLPNGDLTVIDLKTGRLPETAEQLGLYKVGLELLTGAHVRWGYYWHPEKGHGQPLALEQYTPEYFGRLFADAAKGMNAGVFLPKPANNCRSWCGVSRYCAAVNGPLASTVDPLVLV